MLKLIYFLAGWIVGIIVMNIFIFNFFIQFIKNENAIATIIILLTAFYTGVWGIICIKSTGK
jgi:hypothetical protein